VVVDRAVEPLELTAPDAIDQELAVEGPVRSTLLVGMAVDQSRSIHAVQLPRLNGQPESLSVYAGKVVLAVNVASRCGFTPQYAGLQALHERYSARGFTVLGFPCNQFMHQEPGDAEQIQEFCSLNYGVTFPMFGKLDVKGPNQHPLYAILTELADDSGKGGGVAWNFEKFLIDRSGHAVRRFRSKVTPEDARLIDAIEGLL
jgi:glutathione peroxidase